MSPSASDATGAPPSPSDSVLIGLARAALTAADGTQPEWPALDLSDPRQRTFGDYELLEELGRGGQGVVYRARQRSLDREVAIKFIAAGLADSISLARFVAEARAAARLVHPNIVPVHEVGAVEHVHYFSMPLIEGHTLANRLERGELPQSELIALLLTLCEAVDYAHRLGLLHLDLKPANVLIDARGEPLIADFGLARHMDAAGGVDAQEVSGTPSFMAPEQILIKQYRLTAATDIFALGAILYHCLTGVSPHGEGKPDDVMRRAAANRIRPSRELNPRIARDLDAICMKCLELQPDDRYGSAAALADDLRRVRESLPVSVRRPGAFERLQRWFRREPKFAAAAAFAALALLGGAAATAWQWNEAAAQRDLAVAQRDAAEQARREADAQRDRAEGVSALGVWLYAQSDSDDAAQPADGKDKDIARRMLEWLSDRYPGDERRQAQVLTSFAQAYRDENSADAQYLMLPVVEILGGDYRQRVIDALVAGEEPDRYALAARLAWTGDQGKANPERFSALLDRAIAAQPDAPSVWEIAASYCTGVDEELVCHRPEAVRRMVELAPDNAYHWLRLSMQTDGAEAREALRQAAGRRFFDDFYGESMDTFVKAVTKSRVPAPELLAGPARVLAPNTEPEFVIGMMETAAFPLAAWQPFIKRCNPREAYFDDANAYADCKTAGLSMARGRGSLLSRMVGAVVVRRLAQDTPLEREMIELRRHYLYTLEASQQLSPSQHVDYPPKTFHDDMVNAGELEAWQNRLEFYGIAKYPPTDWQPEDPRRLMLPEEREAYDKAQSQSP